MLTTPGPVLVTGATGLVGSSVVIALHKAGFRVCGCARSDQKATQWSESHPDVPIEWHIVPEHSIPNAYDAAAVGCVGAIHIATPVHFFAKTADDIVKPAKAGTLNLLTAAAKSGTVKRVIFTSSVSAFHNHNEEDGFLCPGTVYGDDSWNPATEESAYSGNKTPAYLYSASKTIAEQAAWKWMDENKPQFDLVSLGPATQYGVPQNVFNSFSDLDHATRRLWHYINGKVQELPVNVYPTFTSMLDTAEAHVKALLFPAASGKRYTLVGGYYDYHTIINILHRRIPEQAHRLPPFSETKPPPHFTVVTTMAERDLQMNWRSLEETIVEEARFLYELEKKFTTACE